MGKKAKEYVDLSKVSLLLRFLNGEQTNVKIGEVIFCQNTGLYFTIGMEKKVFMTLAITSGWDRNYTQVTKKVLVNNISLIMARGGSLGFLNQDEKYPYPDDVILVPTSALSHLTICFGKERRIE